MCCQRVYFRLRSALEDTPATIVPSGTLPEGIQGTTNRVAAVITSAEPGRRIRTLLRISYFDARITALPMAANRVLARNTRSSRQRRPAHDGWRPNSAMR